MSQASKSRPGTYRRNGYSEAQKAGIANWAKLSITNRSRAPRKPSLTDQEFGEYRRKIEDLQETERILFEAKEVWE